MSKKEVAAIATLDKILQKGMTQRAAAAQLHLSVRQVQRNLKRYKAGGAAGLVHKSRGKPSPRQIKPAIRNKVAAALHEWCQEISLGPTYAMELLKEKLNIDLSAETVRRIMRAEGLWTKKRRYKKQHHYRPRKDYFGEMTQLDGSWHNWVFGSAEKWMLIGLTDDASSTTYLQFHLNESFQSVSKATTGYFQKYGLSSSVYSDHGGVYSVNNNNEEGDLITQYARSLEQLNITLINANTPQAKGRIERNFQTHQDRLVKDLYFAGIKTIEAANQYLEEVYTPKYNQKFAITAAKADNVHRPITGINFDDVFCLQAKRRVNNDMTIKYDNMLYQLDHEQVAHIRPKEIVTVHERLDGSIFMSLRGYRLGFKIIVVRPAVPQIIKPVGQQNWVPPRNHSWRKTNSLFFSPKKRTKPVSAQSIVRPEAVLAMPT